jgi:homoserine dehydrogenase
LVAKSSHHYCCVAIGPSRLTYDPYTGFIGAEVLRQLDGYHAKHGASHLPVIALLELKGLLSVDPTPSRPGLDLKRWKEDLDTKAVDAGASNLDNFVAHMSKYSPSIIVDCTASEKIAAMYPIWLSKGMHVVTPNKKAFSGPIDLWHKIRSLSAPQPGKLNQPMCYHESSVGAGLPIINTLNDLMRTGDKIIKIEGIFSGTLSFIFNQFSPVSATAGPPPKFSAIVKVAKSKGFTVSVGVCLSDLIANLE